MLLHIRIKIASSFGEVAGKSAARHRESFSIIYPGIVTRSRTALSVGICLLLVAVIWTVFGQTLRHDFVNYDDNRYVYENPVVREGLTSRGIIWAFTHSHSENWHLLTTLSHMLDCQLYGLNPGGHHFGNLLLHTIATLLLFLLLQETTSAVWASAFVAAVFAIHPLHVESVAWIAERKDVLSAVFFMVILLLYVWYSREPNAWRYLAVAMAFVCGLMSKPMLVTVPVILLLLDYWPLRRSERLMWLVLEKLPLFGLSIASSIITLLVQRPTISSLAGLPLRTRIPNAIVSVALYLWQLIWPTKLAVFYPYPQVPYNAWLVIGCAAGIVVMTVATILLRKHSPYLLVGWLWYLVMLVPVLGIVQVGLQSHADRYTYLPLIGVFIAGTWLTVDLTRHLSYQRFVVSAGGVVVMLLLTACSYQQVGYWRDSISLWNRALSVTANNDVAHLCLAEALLQRGKLHEAIAHSQAAIDIRPENAGALGRIPVVLTDKQTQAAIELWETRLKANDNDTAAHNSLGVVLIQSGDPRGAIKQWEQTLAIKPDDGNAENNLAWVLATYPDPTVRDGRRAVELAESATKLPGGQDPIVLRTLAAAYAERGDFPRAIEVAQRAAESARSGQNPSLAEAIETEMAEYRNGSAHREMPRRQ